MSQTPRTLHGRYELRRIIASGGMGDVWEATDAVLGRTVAIKVLRHHDDTFAARFRDEARHTAALQHANIAQIYDFGEQEGTSYLVMELVPGQPLSAIIAQGPLDHETVRSILGQCALALAAAHQQQVIHRDVKPANILVTPDGRVKLTDFGIARAEEGSAHTRTGEVIGTPHYLAPEQALGKPVTGATDLYALGVVGFELLAGRRPFDAGTPVATVLQHVSDAPPPLPSAVREPLRSAIESCLAKDPADRPTSAAALAAHLGMPDTGVSSASPATSVIAMSDLAQTELLAGPTQPLAGPTRSLAGPNQVRPAAVPPTQKVPPAPPPAAAPAQAKGARGGASMWWLAVAALAFLTSLGVWYVVAGPGRSTPPPTTPPVVTLTRTVTPSAPPTTPPPATSAPNTPAPTTPAPPAAKKAQIKEKDLVGLALGDVQSALTELGFTNVQVNMVEAKEDAGVVVGITPNGNVTVTDPITVSVSSGPKKQ